MSRRFILATVLAVLTCAVPCGAVDSAQSVKPASAAERPKEVRKTTSAGKESAQAQLGSYNAGEAISINSDRLVADNALGKVVFSGKVVARQGEIVIYAEELIVYFSSGQKDGGARDIDRVECSGDVRIVYGSRVATGQKATFFRREGRVVLTGAPKVIQGSDFVEGDEITVFLNEEKSIVSSQQGSRVNATFNPGGEKK